MDDDLLDEDPKLLASIISLADSFEQESIGAANDDVGRTNSDGGACTGEDFAALARAVAAFREKHGCNDESTSSHTASSLASAVWAGSAPATVPLSTQVQLDRGRFAPRWPVTCTWQLRFAPGSSLGNCLKTPAMNQLAPAMVASGQRRSSFFSLLSEEACVGVYWLDCAERRLTPVKLLKFSQQNAPESHAWSDDGCVMTVAGLQLLSIYDTRGLASWAGPATPDGGSSAVDDSAVQLVRRIRLYFWPRDTIVLKMDVTLGNSSDAGQRAGAAGQFQYLAGVAGADGLHFFGESKPRNSSATATTKTTSSNNNNNTSDHNRNNNKKNSGHTKTRSGESQPQPQRLSGSRSSSSARSLPGPASTTLNPVSSTSTDEEFSIHDYLNLCVVAASADNSLLAVGALTGHLGIWDVRAARRQNWLQSEDCFWFTHLRKSQRLTSVSFSSDNRVVAAAAWDGAVYIFSAASDDHKAVPFSHRWTLHQTPFGPLGQTAEVTCGQPGPFVCFSPDSQCLVRASVGTRSVVVDRVDTGLPEYRSHLSEKDENDLLRTHQARNRGTGARAPPRSSGPAIPRLPPSPVKGLVQFWHESNQFLLSYTRDCVLSLHLWPPGN